jgi:hypothetical protein
MRRFMTLLASCVALSSCGGDGNSNGGGSASGVTPPPSMPLPSVLATGEVKPSADATFLSASLELTTTGQTSNANGIVTGGMTNDRITTLDTPLFKGSYGPSTGYHLSDAVNVADFGPAQLTTDTTTPNGNGVVLLKNLTSYQEDYLALYQETTYTSSGKGSGYTTARYGGTGGWQHTTVNASFSHTRLDYFAYGSATPASAMPRSGVVNFTMLGSGNYATDTDLWFLTSGSSNIITVDFGAGSVSGSYGLSGQDFYKSVVGGIGSLPIKGSFTGNSMTAPILYGSLNTSSSVSGQFHLLFIGPNANEILVTYVANDGTQAAVGALVGVIDPYF